MSSQISQLLKKGVIRECEPRTDQFISSIFLVPKPDGSSRFILNLKGLNKFIHTKHFKLEDHKTAIKLISKECFMVTLDLKDAFNSISVDESDRKFLRFEFDGITYEFTCMPFGLCTTPHVFTKLLRPAVSILRKSGFLSVIYLDDFLLIGNTYSDCLKNLTETRKLLEKIGFVINEEKSQIVPRKILKFLGFTFNSSRMILELPESKRFAILNQVENFQKISRCKIREFAQLIGSLIACCPALSYSQ